MSMLNELSDYLAGQGITDPIYLGSRPDSPDTLLALYAYPGNPPEYVQESFAPVRERPQIQVVAKALEYEDAEDLIYRAWYALAAITNADLGATRYRSVRPDMSPALLGRDKNDRILLFFNAAVDKEVNVAISS